jgi:hypothetical protein
MKKKGGEQKGSSDVGGKLVLVAVKASKEIPKTALLWALTHIVQPGDCIKLLVVIPAQVTFTVLLCFSIEVLMSCCYIAFCLVL